MDIREDTETQEKGNGAVVKGKYEERTLSMIFANV
jgi:hypothetical protein